MGLINNDGYRSAYSTSLIVGTYIHIRKIEMYKANEMGHYNVKYQYAIYQCIEDRRSDRTEPLEVVERYLRYSTLDGIDIVTECYNDVKLCYANVIQD